MSRAISKSLSIPVRLGVGRLFAAAVCVALIPSLASAQSEKRYEPPSQFDLSSGPTQVLEGNDFQCGVRNQGDTCADIFNSPTGGGGFWPTGTPNQYMFNSGLQVVGMIPADAGFAWAGDTVGAFFMDASGVRQHGTPVTEIYNSLDQEDLDNWPGTDPETGDRVEPNFVGYSASDFPDQGAYITDEELFNEVLIGRRAASQQDSWVLYWDGDPNLTGGRDHPMGILVEQRTLAWNYPSGNENVIYFIYRFTNVTNNPTFQRINEDQYFGGDPNGLPDEGWTFDSVYVAYDSDPDVTGDFRLNYATAVLPFDVGLAYEGTFFEPGFEYSPKYFFPPFFETAPGLLGIKYLKSPVDPATGEEVGLTSFSLHTNGGRFPDPRSVEQGWRFISLNVDPSEGDPDCSFPLDQIQERRVCFLAQNMADVRFFIGSGPFSLAPGESETIATAMYAAATVATSEIETDPNADNKPGEPSLAPGCHGNPIRPIDVAAGYVAPVECPPVGEPIDQFDVEVVPLSLLGRALVAQSIFDNDFLLGFAPEPPNYFLVPGDQQVSVVWNESATEEEGDPFFAAAGDPENPLFDPNYRQFDVEGYRIYKGTTPGNMELLAQFDKEGSVFIDFTCATDPTFITGEECEAVDTLSLDEPFVQYPIGGVVELASGDRIVLEADTALAADIAAGDAEQLSGTGVPFTFVDNNVQNGFQYFYEVTAFDVNSLASGPSSLESSAAPRSVVPRATATGFADASFALELRGANGALTTGPAATPGFDSETGTFDGPQAPTNPFDMDFVAFAPQVLPTGTFEMRIDSLVPRYYGGGYFLTITDRAEPVVVGDPTINSGFSDAISGGTSMTFELPVKAINADPALREELIAQGVDVPPLAGNFSSTFHFERPHWHSGDADWAFQVPGFFEDALPESSVAGGSRWFSGAEQTMADPTLGTQHGRLDGVEQIFQPVPYTPVREPSGDDDGTLAAYDGIGGVFMRRFYQTTWSARRAADIEITWGGGGVESVTDVTHDVPVPFSPAIRASYGFVTDADGDGILTHGDLWHTRGLEETPSIGHISTENPTDLSQTPVLMAIDTDGDLEADGSGFAMYLAGEPYFFLTDAIPSGTTWTYRSYNGAITFDDEEGAYAFESSPGTPAIPGLRATLEIEAPSQQDPAAVDLANVHTVPDPYYGVGPYDLSPVAKELQFVNLPIEATIRIYTVSGVLVDIIQHNDPAAGGRTPWDLRNRSGQNVASGVYFFHVSTPEGESHTGKFTVINSAFGQ